MTRSSRPAHTRSLRAFAAMTAAYGGLLWAALPLAAQTVQVSVDLHLDRAAVSPYLYGKNDFVGSPDSPLSEAGWQRFRDAGVRLLRMHGGNNGTKYNWRKKLTSHPDWYNNVYGADWDYAQTELQRHLPGVQAMWCFQLLGKVADNPNHNFDDWSYNRSQWWAGVGQNLAGGGVPNPNGGGKALTEGNPALYLTDTSAVESTAILDHWIKPDGLGLDRTQFRYWNMDNEPEIWEGTHDDVMPKQISAEAFMQRYFEYAKAARARYPEMKLVGPVPANEWQWYHWPSAITADGRTYPWLEYFIKRVGEEQARTGVRLLDVLDLHYYPAATDPASVVQLHRTFFDPTYVNPDANGVRAVNGGWDDSIKQEYIFGRCQQWLDRYLGAGHGVTLGLTETGLPVENARLASVWYASTLGEFMKHGVEVFTPWSWQPGMWEVLHLYSRYNGATSVRATSSDENTVSAYVTTDDGTGRLTVVLVNRALTASQSSTVELAGDSVPDGSYSTLQLANLPATETFVSHASNALATGSVSLAGNRFSLTLPPLSVTSVLLQRATGGAPPPATEARLANVSVRARSGTGDNVLIVGFVIGGGGSKAILLRGLGPSLGPLGVGSPLPDPVLSLAPFGKAPIDANDNWGAAAAQIAPLAQRLGAYGLDSRSLDAALLVTLPGGPYTATIGDKAGGTGVALGEAYDADLGGLARLVNVSARTWVGTGDDNLIAGFVVTGGTRQTLLVRAVGPGLTALGVSGVLSDPVLSLHRYGVDTPLFQNDDWGSIAYADQIVAAGRRAGAFALDAGSKDAALLVTLPAGVYSAVVNGANNTTGVALVEVYEIQ
jgi:hypothetical protein